ncbi:MAG: hypothetical protein GY749_15540, partial [Desulfobacteraceae bacterium]|nr:hypothetical protein [Desulfobacteraceae bacterium]
METYNYAAIRELVGAVFDDENLIIFCHDCFSDVAKNFGRDQSKRAKIHLLVDYA